MPKVLIVGYGNPLRQDDAVGWLAGQRLSSLYEHDSCVEVVVCHQLTPEMAEPLSRSELALFLDAACNGLPGDFRATEIAASPQQPPDATHHLTPQELLAVSVRLYERSPHAMLLSVTGRQFELGESLSKEAAQGVDQMVERARFLIDTHLS